MPEILDHVAYLSQQIGPRPAGTEEEQQAALYITEQMQKDAGLSAVIEDFSGASNADVPRAVCCGITLLVGILSIPFPVLVLPAVVVTLITCALFAAEALDRPVLSKVFARGVSQNVVAKYEPGYTSEAGGSRRRKIVLVAHYDSGKVRAELKPPLIGMLPILRWASFGAMVFVPLLLLVRAVFFSSATGVTEIVFNVLLIIALVLVLLPIVEALAHKFAAYNEAANCNASGVAVLLEVARRIGRGRVSEAELAAREGDAAIHGEEVARAAGLVPEGAELVYEVSGVNPPEISPQTEENRLAAAKAAIASLTGKPVAGRGTSDISEHLVQIKEPPLMNPTPDDIHVLHDETREALMTIPPDTVQTALENAGIVIQGDVAGIAAQGAASMGSAAGNVAISMPETSSADDGVPDWFKKAQAKAKKPKEEKAVPRSRFADALNTAEQESHARLAASMGSAETSGQGFVDRQGLGGQSFAQAENEQAVRTGGGIPGQSGTNPANAAGVAVLAEGTEQDQAPSAPQSSATPATGAPSPVLAPDATHAMPPLDISDLRPGEIPPMSNISMPSFLDPSKVQAEKLEARGEVQRTDSRMNVNALTADDVDQLSSQGISVLDPAMNDAGLTAPASPLNDSPQDEAGVRHRRPIVLPDIGAPSANLSAITELPKQRAPLADAGTSGKSTAKSLLTMLPAIDPSQDALAGAGQDESAANASAGRPDLRAALPSLSGALPRPADSAVNVAGSFMPAGATGAFAPVGDELLENVHPEDIYVDDADDSAYDEEMTDMGAFAGSGYVEMPKSRAHRLFDRFRKRKSKDEEASTPQEWLEVDDEFDAREVGAARGGWESFREEDAAGVYTDDAFQDDSFTGYAQNDQYAPQQSNDPYSYDEPDDFDDDSPSPQERRRWNGGGFSRRRMGQPDDAFELDEFDDAMPEMQSDLTPSLELAEPSELNQIYQFRNPDINTEVWFVALGSEMALHGGMRAFLAEHNQDLKGSIIIDIGALGVGDLCMIEREGMYRKSKTSSRMKRYTRKASQGTGLSVGSASILWDDSAASVAIKQGFQAMHIVGMDGAKPAYFAQSDDVLENVNEGELSNNADFIMEMLKNI